MFVFISIDMIDINWIVEKLYILISFVVFFSVFEMAVLFFAVLNLIE